MADRANRIPALIMRNISEIIQRDVKDPNIGFCTVNEVKVSKDFSYAKVYVSFLGAKHPEINLEALNKAKGFIRSELAHRLDIRKTPELSFYIDDTFDKYERLNEILKK